MNDGFWVFAGSFITALFAYGWRYIRRDDKKRPPQEVLYEGYEKLLHSYQNAITERDKKIDKLETAFNHLQGELNTAHNLLRDMREDNLKKSRMITQLEQKLIDLKTTADHVVNGG